MVRAAPRVAVGVEVVLCSKLPKYSARDRFHLTKLLLAVAQALVAPLPV